MTIPTPQGEVRPSVTETPAPAFDFTPPLLRLRAGHRQAITPETCLVQQCPVCQWRREGLLDAHVVRETPRYGASCPRCAYALGRDHGRADGPESRPSRDWLDEADVDPVVYLAGYDRGCRERTTLTLDTPLWDTTDALADGLPF